MYVVRVSDCKQDAIACWLTGLAVLRIDCGSPVSRDLKSEGRQTNVEMSFPVSNALLRPWVTVVTRRSHHIGSTGAIGARFVTSAPPRRCGRVPVPHGAVQSMAAVLQVGLSLVPAESVSSRQSNVVVC